MHVGTKLPQLLPLQVCFLHEHYFLLSVVLTAFVSHNVCFFFNVFSPFQVLPAINFIAGLKYSTESV